MFAHRPVMMTTLWHRLFVLCVRCPGNSWPYRGPGSPSRQGRLNLWSSGSTSWGVCSASSRRDEATSRPLSKRTWARWVSLTVAQAWQDAVVWNSFIKFVNGWQGGKRPQNQTDITVFHHSSLSVFQHFLQCNSSWVYMGTLQVLWFLPLSPYMHIRLTDISNLALCGPQW